jgi:hypothetical protein
VQWLRVVRDTQRVFTGDELQKVTWATAPWATSRFIDFRVARDVGKNHPDAVDKSIEIGRWRPAVIARWLDQVSRTVEPISGSAQRINLRKR